MYVAYFYIMHLYMYVYHVYHVPSITRHCEDLRLWSVDCVQTHGQGEEAEQEVWHASLHRS